MSVSLFVSVYGIGKGEIDGDEILPHIKAV